MYQQTRDILMQLSLDLPPMHVCPQCQIPKPLTPEYFYRNRTKPLGFEYACKVCQKPKNTSSRRGKYQESKHRWYIANREHKLAQGRAWKAAHPEDPAKHSARWQAWASQHRKRTDHNRRVQQLDRQSIEQAFAAWGFACTVCSRAAAPGRLLALDHWIPLTRGGPPVATNRLPLCHGIDGCNNSKADKDPWQWLTEKLGPNAAAEKLEAINVYFASIHLSATSVK
jgi:hypothetical protein